MSRFVFLIRKSLFFLDLRFFGPKNMEFCLKWVHMAKNELILRLDGALWLTTVFKPLLTPKRAFTIQFDSYFLMFVTENVSMIWNVK